MAKLIQALLLVVLCIAFSCRTRFKPDDIATMNAYINEPENGLLKSEQSLPFAISVQYLPAAYLQRIQASDGVVSLPADETATFQLRITSLNKQEPLPGLLLQRAPNTWTRSQEQQARFYGFEAACSLHLGHRRIKPLFATVEMTAQTQ